MDMNKKLITLLLSLTTLQVSADVILGKKEILLDNNAVQVVRLTYPVGSESGMHTHEFPNRVVYVIKSGTLTLVPADLTQPTNTIEFTEGTTLFLPTTEHNVQNTGKTEVVLIETEIK